MSAHALGAALLCLGAVPAAVRAGWGREASVRLPRARFGARVMHRGRDRLRGEARELVVLRTVLGGGGSVLQAFERIAEGGGAWSEPAAQVVRSSRRGLSLGDALDEWARADPDGSVMLLADALAIAAVTGGSAVAAVDAVVDTVRERAELAREVHSMAAQARASALVLVVSPVSFALVLALIDARVRGFYIGSLAGWACVAGGIALDVCGALWMARLVRSVR